jgi:hypothetical protein
MFIAALLFAGIGGYRPNPESMMKRGKGWDIGDITYLGREGTVAGRSGWGVIYSPATRYLLPPSSTA